jgi:regulator of replication initiation timing
MFPYMDGNNREAVAELLRQLEQVIAELRAANAQLQTENAQLEAENVQLRARIEEGEAPDTSEEREARLCEG